MARPAAFVSQMTIGRRISSAALGQWRPDRVTARLWLAAVTLSFGVWFSLFLVLSRAEPAGAAGAVVLMGGALLLGVAYGSFFTSISLVARAALKRLGDTVPLDLSPLHAVRVALLAYVAHIAALGVLFAFGLWKLSSPWYLGLVALLWSYHHVDA